MISCRPKLTVLCHTLLSIFLKHCFISMTPHHLDVHDIFVKSSHVTQKQVLNDHFLIPKEGLAPVQLALLLVCEDNRVQFCSVYKKRAWLGWCRQNLLLVWPWLWRWQWQKQIRIDGKSHMLSYWNVNILSLWVIGWSSLSSLYGYKE